MEPGTYPRTWDGKDKDGRTLSSGIYLIKMTTRNDVYVKKAMLMK